MQAAQQLRTVNVTRYVTPLREGGSMPAIVECDDNFLYALKFKGAGQGKRALIAELIGGEIARAIGLHVPEIVFANLDEAFGRMEGDQEIQDLLKASTGLNLALHYLSGAISFDAAIHTANAETASQIVLLDSLLLNVDRTARNTNMLWWRNELWLIDHGASLYFHHNWPGWQGKATLAFEAIKNHVLLKAASKLDEAADLFRRQLTNARLEQIVALIPDEFLAGEPFFSNVDEHRNAYLQFLTGRMTHLDDLVKTANNAR
jgi:hypothetical protein